MFPFKSNKNKFRGVKDITSFKEIPEITGLEDRNKSLIKGGIIHHEVRKRIQNYIKPGIKLSELAIFIEDNIRELTKNKGLNNGIGFQPSLSITECAAHFGPDPKKNLDRVLKESDNIKIDFGVVVNGWIVDCAFSIYFDEKYDNLHKAVLEATNHGIKTLANDVIIREWGKGIQEVMESYEIEINNETKPIKCIKNLGGHNIIKNKIHGGMFLPSYEVKNYSDNLRFKDGVYAVETFGGIDCSFAPSRHSENSNFMYQVPESSYHKFKNKDARKLHKKIIKKFNGIPFGTRHLEGMSNKIDSTMKYLTDSGLIKNYPPLYTSNGLMSAQYEHTLILENGKKYVVSQFEDY
jgi:methionyl aminopeptidase